MALALGRECGRGWRTRSGESVASSDGNAGGACVRRGKRTVATNQDSDTDDETFTLTTTFGSGGFGSLPRPQWPTAPPAITVTIVDNDRNLGTGQNFSKAARRTGDTFLPLSQRGLFDTDSDVTLPYAIKIVAAPGSGKLVRVDHRQYFTFGRRVATDVAAGDVVVNNQRQAATQRKVLVYEAPSAGLGAGGTSFTFKIRNEVGGESAATYTATLTRSAGTNNAPTVSAAIADRIGTKPGSSRTVNLSNHFTDGDSGDTLSHLVEVARDDIVSPSISGGTLTLAPMGGGTASVKVTASDGKDGELL